MVSQIYTFLTFSIEIFKVCIVFFSIKMYIKKEFNHEKIFITLLIYNINSFNYYHVYCTSFFNIIDTFIYLREHNFILGHLRARRAIYIKQLNQTEYDPVGMMFVRYLLYLNKY